MPLQLVEMDAGDFARRRAPLVAGYARAITASRGLTLTEAEAVSARDIDDQLTRGPATRGHYLRKALRDGTEVGWIWVALPGRARPDMAWISDIEVDPEFRSRGYAGEILTAAHTGLTGLGVRRIGLNVFADNPTARRVYERLGYRMYAQQRTRALVDVPASDGVELVPMADYESRIEALSAEYAADLVHEQGLWHGEAETRAARRLAGLLPDGARTEGMILRTVVAGGVAVGWVWAGLPAPPRPGLGWLHTIEIDEPYRSQGYGRAAIAAVEAGLVRRGVRSMGLDVHGDNTGAQRLYERLGYRVVARQMARDLPAVA